MKLKLKRIMTAAPVLLLLAGCARQEVDFTPAGSLLTARLESDSDTRVSVSGKTSGDEGGKFSWNTGDKIAVYVDGAYKKDIVVEPSTGRISVNGTRSHFAVYPADAADDANYGNTTLNVTLPDSYDISDIVAASGTTPSDPYARDEDWSPVPMVAVNDPLSDILYFRHVGGLLRVKWAGMPADTKSVTVEFDTDITGSYTVNLTDPYNPTIKTQGTATNNKVTFKISDSGLSAAQTVCLNIPVPTGNYGSVTLKAYDMVSPDASSTPIAGSTHQFISGTGVKLEFARHWARMLGMDGAYTYVLDGLQDVLVEYTGGGPELAHSFVSYKTDGVDYMPVPYVLEYSSTPTDPTSWTTTLPKAEPTDTDPWFTMDAGNEFGGSTQGITLRVDISAQPNRAVDTHANNLKTASLPDGVGTSVATAFDLSTKNVATGETVATSTANCYVVQAPGYYKFPLVYGNSLKHGSLNQFSFNSLTANSTLTSRTWRKHDRQVYPHVYGEIDESSSAEESPNLDTYYGTHTHTFYLLGQYRNHGDNRIVPQSSGTQQVYIAHKLSGMTLTAKIIWTDAEGLVTDAVYSNNGTPNNPKDDYISFQVPQATICQGNAMIAILANGVIAWSWHIWVTDEDLTDRKTGSNSYEFAPVNIGWCDARDTQKYPQRMIYVRARQTDPSGITSPVKQILSKAGRQITIGGHSPYYQWGRKDPLQSGYIRTTVTVDWQTLAPVTTQENVEDTYYYHSDYASVAKNHPGEWVTIGEAIQHPYVRYHYNGTDPHGWNWCMSWIINLWNSYISGWGESYSNVIVLKTIYDPSPVGYSIPPRAAYSTFSSSNFVPTTVNGTPGRMFNGTLFFPEAGYRSSFDDIRFDYAKYWSATMEALCGDYREAYSLSYTPEFTYVLTASDPDALLPVRPVKDVKF